MEQFDSTLAFVIDPTLSLRCGLFHFMARFLAMAEFKQAWLCSFGLTKTFVFIRGIRWRGSSLYQPSESRHQGGMCWVSIPVIMLIQMYSRQILDNAYNLWVWYCVLPQVALWGQRMLRATVGVLASIYLIIHNESTCICKDNVEGLSCGFADYPWKK